MGWKLCRLFDGIANRNEGSQYAAERFWGQMVGFEEAHHLAVGDQVAQPDPQ